MMVRDLREWGERERWREREGGGGGVRKGDRHRESEKSRDR